MSENLTILQFRDGQLYWREPGTGVAHLVAEQNHDQDNTRQRLAAELRERQHQVVFAVPGGDIRLLELPVSAEERRHLDSALPFMLEEQLSEDIEELHFPRRALADDQFGIAVVSRDRMDAWQEVLGDLAPQLPWVPEPLLLPWEAGSWTLALEEDRAVLRCGECRGASVEVDLLETLLASLAMGALPERIVVYGTDDHDGGQWIPESLRPRVEWRRGGLDAALLLSVDSGDRLDLRQGDYAPRLPYERWWSQWRKIAAVLAVAVSVHALSGWLDLQHLERQNLALRQEIESVYREANPRGAVVDPEKQLRRQLADLQGGGGDASFSGLLAPLGYAMAERNDMLLASLNYSQRSGELRINLLAPTFADVEGLREALVTAGLEASLESSSRSGDRVRARLRIGGGA